jgi:hypothetical protein
VSFGQDMDDDPLSRRQRGFSRDFGKADCPHQVLLLANTLDSHITCSIHVHTLF